MIHKLQLCGWKDHHFSLTSVKPVIAWSRWDSSVFSFKQYPARGVKLKVFVRNSMFSETIVGETVLKSPYK